MADLHPEGQDEQARIDAFDAHVVIPELQEDLEATQLALTKSEEARGRLEGERDAASWPGVIEGWRDRAERAEARQAELEAGRDKALMMVRGARIGAKTTGQHGTVQLMNEIEAALAGVAEQQTTGG